MVSLLYIAALTTTALGPVALIVLSNMEISLKKKPRFHPISQEVTYSYWDHIVLVRGHDWGVYIGIGIMG